MGNLLPSGSARGEAQAGGRGGSSAAQGGGGEGAGTHGVREVDPFVKLYEGSELPVDHGAFYEKYQNSPSYANIVRNLAQGLQRPDNALKAARAERIICLVKGEEWGFSWPPRIRFAISRHQHQLTKGTFSWMMSLVDHFMCDVTYMCADREYWVQGHKQGLVRFPSQPYIPQDAAGARVLGPGDVYKKILNQGEKTKQDFSTFIYRYRNDAVYRHRVIATTRDYRDAQLKLAQFLLNLLNGYTGYMEVPLMKYSAVPCPPEDDEISYTHFVYSLAEHILWQCANHPDNRARPSHPFGPIDFSGRGAHQARGRGGRQGQQALGRGGRQSQRARGRGGRQGQPTLAYGRTGQQAEAQAQAQAQQSEGSSRPTQSEPQRAQSQGRTGQQSQAQAQAQARQSEGSGRPTQSEPQGRTQGRQSASPGRQAQSQRRTSPQAKPSTQASSSGQAQASSSGQAQASSSRQAQASSSGQAQAGPSKAQAGTSQDEGTPSGSPKNQEDLIDLVAGPQASDKHITSFCREWRNSDIRSEACSQESIYFAAKEMGKVIRLRMMLGHLEYNDPLALLPKKDKTVRNFIEEQSSWRMWLTEKEALRQERKREKNRQRKRQQASERPGGDGGEAAPPDPPPASSAPKVPPPPFIDLEELEPIARAPFQKLSTFAKLARYCTFELD